MRPPRPAHLVLLTAFTSLLRVSGVEDEKFPKPAVVPMRGASMQYGPVFCYSIEVPGAPAAEQPTAAAPASASSGAPKAPAKVPSSQVIPRGVVLKLGEGDNASVCFDTDLLRIAVAWTGGFLDLRHTNIATYKGDGTGAALVSGSIRYETPALPGWTTGEFADPRPEKQGALPRELGRYRGLHVNGARTVVEFEAAGCAILESAGVISEGAEPMLVRYFEVGPSEKALSVLLDRPSEAGVEIEGQAVTIKRGDKVVRHRLIGAPAAAALKANGTAVYATIPARQETIRFAVICEDPAQAVKAKLEIPDLKKWSEPGPAKWPALEAVAGVVSSETAAYVVDTIPVPEENPWKSWMRISALDFLPDGKAVVATLNGDVWLVDGLDAQLSKVRWKRFATGLFEPLGVKVRGGEIYVHGRDQISRLWDLNRDGEADSYECFNNDCPAVANYHAFVFDLQTDRAGNFYFVTGGNQFGAHRPHYASVTRVSADGSKSEEIATGFRAPNGMTVGPNDEIIVGDNQGHWIPSSKVNLVRPGGFYGHVADPRIDPKAPAPANFDLPICWIPMTMDNSSGGQIWEKDSGKWGPYGGHLLHLSYGTCSLFAVMPQATSGGEKPVPVGVPGLLPAMQGAVTRVPVKFTSGVMRGRFNPVDGQLYVVGLKGWQTSAAKDGCFQRVRYTGGVTAAPAAVHAAEGELKLQFTTALDRDTMTDPAGYSIEQWNYQWWSTYGSPDLSPSQKGAKKRDRVDVEKAELSADGRTLTLKIPGLQVAMETLVKGTVRTADGTEAKLEVAGSFYELPKPSESR